MTTEATSNERVNLQRTLRRLIVCDIVLLIAIVAVSLLEERFLPAELRSYLDSVSEQGWSTADWIFMVLGVPLFVLLIVAWIALWRGWRSGRRLYTVVWVGFLPLSGSSAPFIMGPVLATIEPLAYLVPGLILGLLYFSELRLTYETQVA